MPWKHWSSERIGVALAIAAAFGFSFKAIFVKLAYAVPQAVPVDAVTLLSLRMVFALPFFAWVGLREGRGAPPLSRRDWALITVLGLLGYYASSLFDFIGLHYISAGLERLILFTYPTLTVLIGVLFMGRPLTRREIGAIALSYAGIALAFVHDVKIGDDTQAVLIGGAFVFASSLTYALYNAGAADPIRRLGSARFAALAMLVSVGATQAHFFVTQPLTALIQPWPVLACGIGMAIFSTVLPVFMQSAAVRRIGPSRTVLIGTLGPVLTIFFSWPILGEPFSLEQLAGAGLVLAGVLLVSRQRRA
ncbi:DMT family transporter [Rhodocyclus tenuis]|uniref:Drug/metabolite transporter (DMT)-like permease n=1 Tax=Rhodocyclus tenuis TaxID=1066 RepID=A0A840FWJ5_RHOTE|nr:DMT family transporter [Rhodocyclus tenuis]MBB4246134.1 drug/metabolite transporter (DMT)-like permease [Rhodocyclus tenuis]